MLEECSAVSQLLPAISPGDQAQAAGHEWLGEPAAPPAFQEAGVRATRFTLPPGLRVPGNGAPIPPRHGRGRPGLGTGPGPTQNPLISGWLRSKLIVVVLPLCTSRVILPSPLTAIGGWRWCTSIQSYPTATPPLGIPSPPAGWPRRTGAAWAGRSRSVGRRDVGWGGGAHPGTGRAHDRSSETVVKWSRRPTAVHATAAGSSGRLPRRNSPTDVSAK